MREVGLETATDEQFRNELTGCLALVAGVGMSEDDKAAWLLAAWGTLREYPADLLAIGCKAARKRADHPSKIVPAIVQETQTLMDARRRWLSRKMEDSRPQPVARALPQARQTIPLDEVKAMTPLLRRIGVEQGWITRAQLDACGDGRSENTRAGSGYRAVAEAEYSAAAHDPARRTFAIGKPRMPTRDDYIALGVSPAILDGTSEPEPEPEPERPSEPDIDQDDLDWVLEQADIDERALHDDRPVRRAAGGRR